MTTIIRSLTGAVLFQSESDLCWANLREANLRGADLRGANLRGADLRWANLRGADLRGADPRWANLCGADLSGADLRGAGLRGADLSGANLRGALRADDVPMTLTPVTVDTGRYLVRFWDRHVEIGCQLLEIGEWLSVELFDVEEMDGARALEFWRTWREPLVAIARATGRLPA